MYGAYFRRGGLSDTLRNVTSLVIGYARVSRFGADADEQRAALLVLGVEPERVYLDAGLTGMTRPRPALREALAAARWGEAVGRRKSVSALATCHPRTSPRAGAGPRTCRPDSAAAAPERA